ncbi:MAG: hypothetical protein HYX92_16565 [Chloroflexi bacterium]|nr:hypothetical protein [Chloroflexota bacterium]
MADYRFERECRTPYSEVYTIIEDGERIGRLDLHFTISVVYATLCVPERLTTDAIQSLIEVIDDELVMSSDVARDDFVVTVFQGREAGVYSDEEMEEDEDMGDIRL